MDVKRVLKPGGNFVVTFEKLKPSASIDKIIQAWYFTTDIIHLTMVTFYFEVTGPWSKIEISELDTKDEKVYVMNGIK